MPQEIDVMARTMWAEARGEGRAALIAVGHVIRNRAAHPRWWGQSVIGVCKQPWQFSCWNRGDPNLPKLLAVSASVDHIFAECIELAADIIGGRIPDPTQNSDSYFDTSIPTPVWARGIEPVFAVANLRFYRLELHPPA